MVLKTINPSQCTLCRPCARHQAPHYVSHRSCVRKQLLGGIQNSLFQSPNKIGTEKSLDKVGWIRYSCLTRIQMHMIHADNDAFPHKAFTYITLHHGLNLSWAAEVHTILLVCEFILSQMNEYNGVLYLKKNASRTRRAKICFS